MRFVDPDQSTNENLVEEAEQLLHLPREPQLVELSEEEAEIFVFGHDSPLRDPPNMPKTQRWWDRFGPLEVWLDWQLWIAVTGLAFVIVEVTAAFLYSWHRPHLTQMEVLRAAAEWGNPLHWF